MAAAEGVRIAPVCSLNIPMPDSHVNGWSVPSCQVSPVPLPPVRASEYRHHWCLRQYL